MSQIIKPLTSSGPIPGNVATTYDANTGSATPTGNILNILGINGATTAGSGNTITISPGFATSQFVSNTVLKTAPITLTSGVSQTITSITLQPGNWSISGIVEASSDNANEDLTTLDISISTVNNTLSGVFGLSEFNSIITSGNEKVFNSIPAFQVSIVAPTTYYLVVNASFNLAVIAYGTISAIGQLQSGGGGVTFPITVAQGGTGLTSTTANQLLYSSSNSVIAGLATATNGVLVTNSTGIPSILAGPGTTGNILRSNSAVAPSFSSATYPGSTTINQILYSSASNAITGLATANSSVLTTDGSGVPSWTTTPSFSTTTLTGGQIVAVTTPGAYPYTTLTTDYLILVDTTSARTIIPLGSPVKGTTYHIKDNVGSAAANNITITPSGKNIDGAASFVMTTNYGSVDIVYNGTQWNVV